MKIKNKCSDCANSYNKINHTKTECIFYGLLTYAPYNDIYYSSMCLKDEQKGFRPIEIN